MLCIIGYDIFYKEYWSLESINTSVHDLINKLIIQN